MSAPSALRLAAGAFAFFGAWSMYSIGSMLGLIGINAGTTAGVIELRAFYGGSELGFAIYLWLASRRPAWAESALAAALSIFLGCALVRTIGMLFAADANVFNLVSLSGELAAASLMLWCLRGQRR